MHGSNKDFAIMCCFCSVSEKAVQKLWNMKVMVIPFVISALRKVLKSQVRKLEELEIKLQHC